MKILIPLRAVRNDEKTQGLIYTPMVKQIFIDHLSYDEIVNFYHFEVLEKEKVLLYCLKHNISFRIYEGRDEVIRDI